MISRCESQGARTVLVESRCAWPSIWPSGFHVGRNYFPVVFVEDRLSGVTWGAQLAHPASWQIDVSRRDGALSLSGGLADREFGHWTKRLEPGATFVTPTAYLTVVCGDIDEAAHRLTAVQARALVSTPPSEQDLPVIFNEYCTSWGSPSSRSLYAIAERLKDKDIRYLVIDAGWYNRDGALWYNSMGDWEVNRKLFPDGLDEALTHIRSCGMIPGIWFEMEVCGEKATAFDMGDHFLKRDGIPITVAKRRFWDFRDPFVVAYLQEKVIDFLVSHGIGYLKLDYNDSLGIGCDGAESLGEGLRQQMVAVQRFIRRIQEAVPNIVMENCASGGAPLRTVDACPNQYVLVFGCPRMCRDPDHCGQLASGHASTPKSNLGRAAESGHPPALGVFPCQHHARTYVSVR